MKYKTIFIFCLALTSILATGALAETLGYTPTGSYQNNMENIIVGNKYTATQDGIADNMTIETNYGNFARLTSCALYGGVNSTELLGNTSKVSIPTGSNKVTTLAFPDGSKPTITAGMSYVLSCWAEAKTGSAQIYRDTSVGFGMATNDYTFGNFPAVIVWENLGGAYPNSQYTMSLGYTLVVADTCSDTDGGNVPGTAGTTSGTLDSVAYSNDDVCTDASNVMEYACSGTTEVSTVENCGTDTSVDYCVGDDIYRNSTDYSCASGACGSVTTNEVLVQNCALGCSAGTCTGEVDPVFTASHAFGINWTMIENWNIAFGWGNHALAGYSTGDHYDDSDIDGTEAAFTGWDKDASDDFDGTYASLDFTGTTGLSDGIDDNTQLTEAEVDAFCDNNGYSSGAHTVDTDTQLTEAEVDAFVANNGYLTSSGFSGNCTTGVVVVDGLVTSCV